MSPSACLAVDGRSAPAAAARWILLLLLAICLPGLAIAVQTTGRTCATPIMPQNLSLPSCPPTMKTLDDARASAWKYAPIVYVHPLELYLWQDAALWYNKSAMFMQDYLPAYRLDNGTWVTNSTYGFMFDTDATELLFEPRTFATIANNSELTQPQKDAIIKGAPLDAHNVSTAPVYYTVTELNNGTWYYNYNLYYSWNGCSNQAMAISINGSHDVLDYVACPLGVHEGDWERVSLLVCAETGEMEQVSYSQHSWWETRLADNVTYEEVDGVKHPVAYSALESHANYFDDDQMMVYEFINASIRGVVSLDNFGGVWIVDRTGPLGQNRRFVPTPENIIEVPAPQTVLDQNLSEWYWSTYAGDWGAPLAMPPIDFVCIYDGGLTYEQCPNTQATKALKLAFTALGVADKVTGLLGGGNAGSNTTSTDLFYFSKNPTNYTQTGYPSIPGAMLRAYSYTWLQQRTAPINMDTSASHVISCPADVVLTDKYL